MRHKEVAKYGSYSGLSAARWRGIGVVDGVWISTSDTLVMTLGDGNETDDELAGMAQQDRAAFATLYRRHLDRVFRYCVVQVGDAHQAQDLTAQTFLAALEHIESYRGEGTFRAWLLSIARNKVRDQFRSRRSTLPLEAAFHMPSVAASPERIVEVRLRLEQVMHALAQLPPDRSEALALRIFAGLSVAEAGAVMGRSEAATKMLVHRGLEDLRARLTRYDEDGEGEHEAKP
jgi:RNA polymerase sigma-70 factor (ECF subfamily)